MRFRSRLCALGLVWVVGSLALPVLAQPNAAQLNAVQPAVAPADEPVPHDTSEGSSADDKRVRIRVTDEAGKPVPRARL